MMTTKKEIEAKMARVKELNRTIEDCSEEKEKLMESIALLVAKYKIGQRVEYRSRGVFEITDIRSGGFAGSVRYFGRKVLKGGGLHSLETELWAFDQVRDIRPLS